MNAAESGIEIKTELFYFPQAHSPNHTQKLVLIGRVGLVEKTLQGYDR